MKAWLILRFGVLLALCVSSSGCYYLQAAQGQLSVMARRQPIERVLASPQTDSALRNRLEQVRAARRFAVTELGLPDNRSYTTYADIGRRYVVWNVFAAAEFSVQPQQWCFPVAGCVVYRGYFSESAAQRFARSLRRRGFDASVAGVAAYSTLGHFNDPVLSSMLNWSDAQVAATLFHELAHQVVYVPGDARFNEAFATVVEEVGLQRWLAAQDRQDEWQRWQVDQQRDHDVSALLRATRNDLRELYAAGGDRNDLRAAKQRHFGQLKFEYAQLAQHWATQGMSSHAYDAWFGRFLSNADFIADATYRDCVPVLQQQLAKVGGDLPMFYVQMKKMARLDAKTRQSMCDQG